MTFNMMQLCEKLYSPKLETWYGMNRYTAQDEEELSELRAYFQGVLAWIQNNGGTPQFGTLVDRALVQTGMSPQAPIGGAQHISLFTDVFNDIPKHTNNDTQDLNFFITARNIKALMQQLLYWSGIKP